MQENVPTSAAEAFSRPFDMSSIPADPGPSPTVDEPAGEPSDEPAATVDEPAPEPKPEAEAAPKPDIWEQTPEEKRRQRLNDLFEAQNREHRRAEELQAKLAKLEAGEAKPPAPQKTRQEWLDEALMAEKEDGLSDHQRQVRRLASELVEIEQRQVVPARTAVNEAEKAVGELQSKVQKKQNVLEDLQERSKGREGLYDAEIEETQRALDRLENQLLKAQNAFIQADIKHARAVDDYRTRQAATRHKVANLADDSDRITREAVSQKEEAEWLASEQGKLNTAWEKATTEALAELGLDPEIHDAAHDRAFLYVQRMDQKRAAEGGKPIEASEFKTLILESLQQLAKLHGKASGRTEGQLAETRAAATAQPGPRNRVAKGGDTKHQTVEEAADELRRTLRASNLRRTPAA